MFFKWHVFLVGLCLIQLGFYPHILTGGYPSYRAIVTEYLKNNLADVCCISAVITGPPSDGKKQLIDFLCEFGEQVVDLEHLSQIYRFSQEFFETNLFNLFLSFNSKETIWFIFEPGEIGDLVLPTSLENVMSYSSRLHVEEDLELRIKFILQESMSFVCPML